jgi:hypothetical protein
MLSKAKHLFYSIFRFFATLRMTASEFLEVPLHGSLVQPSGKLPMQKSGLVSINVTEVLEKRNWVMAKAIRCICIL